LFVTAPLVQREHAIAMVEFAHLHVKEEKKRFDDQQRAGPEEHGPRQKNDLPEMDLARAEDSGEQAGNTEKKEIAQDIGRVYAVIRLGASRVCCHHSSLCHFDVCLAEVHSLEKKGFTGRPRKRIREAIAKVQLRRVASLTEIKEGLPSQVRMFDRNRLNNDFSSPQKHIALATDIRTQLAFYHYRELNKIGGADPATISLMNHLDITVSLGLAEEDGAQCGRVENHFGRPRSSYRY
jgi:hypothetical protein